ncbi:MAG: efflux RND transporter periplasmic adaptor subunit [Dehalococcoidia bacterium]|jgi:multidrug efflux pump subunit AcrA (membrane-fusion protein)
MRKLIKTSLIVLLACLSVLSVISCSAAKPAAAARTRTVTVKRGDLAINVSVDGNLNMPNEYDLRFGAPGQVENITVQDGDTVKAGEILATLDDKTERQGLETASNTLQQTLSSLYETIPLTPQVSGYVYTPTIPPPNYPNDTLPPNSPYILLPPAPPNSPNPPPPPVIEPPSAQYPSGRTWESVLATPNPPTYFGPACTLEALNWAQTEIYNAYSLVYSDNYTMAASQLNMAAADLESCARILQDTVDNPQSGLGNTAHYMTDNNTWPFLLNNIQNGATSNILDVRRTIALLRQREADVQQIQGSISDNGTAAAGPLFHDLFSQLQTTSSAVYSYVYPNFIKAYYTYPWPFQDISSYFYGKAQDSLNNTLDSSQTGEINSLKFYENLALGRHYMELANSFLGSNEIDLQHGLSQPAEQNFKVNLSKNAVALENSNQALLNSIIIAPVDGIVVSVGIKDNDQLSAQTYSSVSAFLVVDTSDIEFKGLVDEIDIPKVKTGQKVTISVDAVPNKTFTGVVSFISPYGNTVGNVVKYNVTILLDPSNVALKGGLSATADIAVDSLKDVLLVPVSALNTTAAGSTVTLVDPNTGATSVKKVTLGIQNLQYAQVTSGLKEGDQIIITLKSSSPVITGLPSPGQQSTQQSGGGGGGPPPR